PGHRRAFRTAVALRAAARAPSRPPADADPQAADAAALARGRGGERGAGRAGTDDRGLPAARVLPRERAALAPPLPRRRPHLRARLLRAGADAGRWPGRGADRRLRADRRRVGGDLPRARLLGLPDRLG